MTSMRVTYGITEPDVRLMTDILAIPGRVRRLIRAKEEPMTWCMIPVGTDPHAPELTPIEPERGRLAHLQRLVGGYIELVRIEEADSVRMVVNEDGCTAGLPRNEAAARLYAGHYSAGLPILGDAVLVGHGVVELAGTPWPDASAAARAFEKLARDTSDLVHAYRGGSRP